MGDRELRRLESRLAREIAIALALLALALIDAVLMPRPFGFALHLVPSLMLARLAAAGVSDTARWALYGGIGQDLTSHTPLGYHVLALLVALLVVYLLSYRFQRDNTPVMIFALLSGLLVYSSMLGLMHSLTLRPIPSWSSYTLFVLLPTALVASIPAVPIFVLLRALTRRA